MLFFFINRVSAKGLVILDEITVFAYFYYKRLMAVYQGAYINFPPEVKPIGWKAWSVLLKVATISPPADSTAYY